MKPFPHYNRIMPPLSPTEQEAFETIWQGWLQKHRMTFWIGIAMSLCAVGCMFLLYHESFEAAIAMSALVFLFASLILTVILNAQDKKAIRAIKEHPAFDPSFLTEERAAALAVQREMYDAASKSLKHRDSVGAILILISLFLNLILPCATLIVLIFVLVWHGQGKKELDAIPNFPERVLEREVTRRTKNLTLGIFLAMISCMGLHLVSSMYGFVAKSKVSSRNAIARQFYNAANTYLMDCAEQGITPDCQTIIVKAADTPEPDSLAAGIQTYISEDRGYYAVVFNEQNELQYVLYSNQPITDLNPMSLEEQLRIEKNPFSGKAAVGCYRPSATTNDKE